jgi:hypothetical protein
MIPSPKEYSNLVKHLEADNIDCHKLMMSLEKYLNINAANYEEDSHQEYVFRETISNFNAVLNDNKGNFNRPS